MWRVLGWVLVAALWFAVGPWVLVAVVAALLIPRVRRAARPRHPWWTAGAVVLTIAAVAAVAVVVPDGRLPIPPGPGALVTPSFTGQPATPQAIDMAVPQHPGLATNGRSSMHDDGWATDSYAGPGPLGRDPQVETAWYGLEECATLAFDTHERLVALCGDLRGPTLHVLDRDMQPLATRKLPDRPDVEGKRAWENLCAGAYFYLDPQDRAVVATTDGRILEFATSSASGRAELTQERAFDVSDELPGDDCLVALMPDWGGLIWFVTQDGRVGTVDTATSEVNVTDLDEAVYNSLAVDEQGVYVVTVDALYKMSSDRSGQPKVAWRAPYDRGEEQKPGQLSRGSGTTPTVLPDGRVAITDNAEPRMNVAFYDTATGREICHAPVFESGASATENSLVSVGDGVIVENNYGYAGPQSTILGRATSGGIARVDLDGDDCSVAWTNDEIAPTSVPKVSLETGLLYAYTKRPTWWGVSAWYLTAVDARTGRTAFGVRTGLGTLMNNHYSAVTLAADGSAYVATLGGMVRVRDGR